MKRKISRTKNVDARTSRSRVRLRDLAHFKIESIAPTESELVSLQGQFTHLIGVRFLEKAGDTVGFLYVSRGDSVYLKAKEFDSESLKATLLAQPSKKDLYVGQSLPYVDYYWDAAQVARALEPASLWKKVQFKPSDMYRYRDPAVPGYWTSHTTDKEPAKGATDIQIVRGGWDHEHCWLCRETIGKLGQRCGYFKKSENQWMCEKCFKKFIARHDLRFLQFKR